MGVVSCTLEESEGKGGRRGAQNGEEKLFLRPSTSPKSGRRVWRDRMAGRKSVGAEFSAVLVSQDDKKNENGG